VPVEDFELSDMADVSWSLRHAADVVEEGCGVRAEDLLAESARADSRVLVGEIGESR
jgi:hypothetical protein